MPSVTEEISLSTASPEDTERFGAIVAECLPAPAVLGLRGPLGAGKTCFVRGFASGLGIDPDQVCSPSFVYLVEYEGGRETLVHADLYRLGDMSPEACETALIDIGLLEAIQGSGLTVVEWWEYYRGEIPERFVSVEFSIETAEDRAVKLSFHGDGMTTVASKLRERLAKDDSG